MQRMMIRFEAGTTFDKLVRAILTILMSPAAVQVEDENIPPAC
jgi:hypothetical protein